MVSDPGLTRLRLAGSTVVAVGLAVAVVVGLASLVGQPATSGLLGVVIAMMASTAVADPTARSRIVTTALIPLPAILAATGGALLAPFPLIGEAGFVVVMAGAAYVRQFGPRPAALGMVSYISYFFALFSHARLGQVPELGVSVIIGAGCSLLVRTVVIRERPEREIARLIGAVRARLGSVVELAIDAVTANASGDPAGSRAWRRRLGLAVVGLSDTALLVEDRLDAQVSAQLGRRVFDAQLAAERLAGLLADTATPVPTATPGRRRTPGGSVTAIDDTVIYPVGAAATDRALVEVVLAVLGALRTALATGMTSRRAPRAGTRLLANSLATTPARTPGGERLREAVVALSRSALAIPDPAGPAAPVTSPPTNPLTRTGPIRSGFEPGGAARRIWWWWGGDVRQPVQVAVAAAASIAVGQLISPSRWYWAAITAFVIYSGTTSAGQTVSKGWQRVAGTVGGMIGGVVVAALVGGDPVWSLVLIGVCIFCAFYLVRVSYGLMSFWITTMLALLYGLLGEFSVALLVLRLQETAAGAAIGITVAYLVLPTSTRTVAAAQARDMLEAVSSVLGHAMRHLWVPGPGRPGQASQAELLAAAGALRTHAQLLRTSARPLTHGPLALPTRDGARRSLRIVLSCGHHARMIARVCAVPTPGPGPLHDPALGAATDAVRRTVHTLITALPTPTTPAPIRHTHTTTRDGADHRGAPPAPTGPLAPRAGTSDSHPVLDRALRAAHHYPPEQRRHMLVVLAHLRGIDHAATELIHDLTHPRPARRRAHWRRALLLDHAPSSHCNDRS